MLAKSRPRPHEEPNRNPTATWSRQVRRITKTGEGGALLVGRVAGPRFPSTGRAESGGVRLMSDTLCKQDSRATQVSLELSQQLMTAGPTDMGPLELEELINRPRWMAQAACRGMDTNEFFEEPGQPVSRAVQELCRSCPVRAECLDFVMAANPPLKGYWAGTSERQRRRSKRQKTDATKRPSPPWGKLTPWPTTTPKPSPCSPAGASGWSPIPSPGGGASPTTAMSRSCGVGDSGPGRRRSTGWMPAGPMGMN